MSTPQIDAMETLLNTMGACIVSKSMWYHDITFAVDLRWNIVYESRSTSLSVHCLACFSEISTSTRNGKRLLVGLNRGSRSSWVCLEMNIESSQRMYL